MVTKHRIDICYDRLTKQEVSRRTYSVLGDMRMFGLAEISVYDQSGTVVTSKCMAVETDGYCSEMSIVVDGYVIDKLYFGEDYDLFADEEEWYGYVCWYVASDRYARSIALIS